MTQDLPAGRELDALIAERVFPGQRWRHDDKCDATGSCWRCGGCLDWCPIPPPYSTDIAAAWQVVEQLRISILAPDGDGMWVAGSEAGNETPVSWAERWSYGERDMAAAEADHAPLAICRAALRAVRQ